MTSPRLGSDLADWSGTLVFGPHQVKSQFPEPITSLTALVSPPGGVPRCLSDHWATAALVAPALATGARRQGPVHKCCGRRETEQCCFIVTDRMTAIDRARGGRQGGRDS